MDFSLFRGQRGFALGFVASFVSGEIQRVGLNCGFSSFSSLGESGRGTREGFGVGGSGRRGVRSGKRLCTGQGGRGKEVIVQGNSCLSESLIHPWRRLAENVAHSDGILAAGEVRARGKQHGRGPLACHYIPLTRELGNRLLSNRRN